MKVDKYIEEFQVEVQERLRAIRSIIFEIAPHITEGISYRMLAYGLNDKWLIYFAGYKKHIGFYPKAEGIASFKDKLSSYKIPKEAVYFPLNKPLPLLIREIITYLVTKQSK